MSHFTLTGHVLSRALKISLISCQHVIPRDKWVTAVKDVCTSPRRHHSPTTQCVKLSRTKRGKTKFSFAMFDLIWFDYGNQKGARYAVVVRIDSRVTQLEKMKCLISCSWLHSFIKWTFAIENDVHKMTWVVKVGDGLQNRKISLAWEKA